MCTTACDGLTGPETTLILRYVRRFSRSLSHHYLDRDDLYCIGRAGLLLARSEYDPRIHPKFEAFARVHVRRAIVAAIRAASPLTEHDQWYARQSRRAAALLRQHGHPVTDANVALVLGVSEDDHRKRRQRIAAVAVVGSLDALPEQDGEASAEAHAMAEARRHQRHNALLGCLARLEREHPIHSRIFHASAVTRLSVVEVCRREGLSGVQVARFHAEAAAYLRDYLVAAGYDAADLLD